MGNSRIQGPVRGDDTGDTEGAGVGSDNTPGPTGIGHDRSTEDIRITPGIPDGVHDARTAIAYAQIHRRMLLYRSISNQELIARARFLSQYLLGACADFGPQAQSETARLLIDLEEEMTRRLSEAEIAENGLPVLDGINWHLDDPLAGITSGIDPFGMLDVWTTYLRTPPTQEIARPSRRRRVTEIEGDAMLITGQGTRVPDSQVISDIHLHIAQTTSDGLRSFAYWFLRNFRNSIISGRFSSNPSYVTGTGGIQRAAFTPPLPREYEQLRRIYRNIDSGPYQTDDILYFARMKRELQRVVRAWEPVFSSQAGNQYQGERRWDLLNTPEYRAFSRVVSMNPPEIVISDRLRSGVQQSH